jgi:hypothetical protein
MPVVRRRRTRSRRTTRRLHRTRRNRGQRGGATGERMDLFAWKAIVDEKKSTIENATDTLDILTRLKDDRLTLTKETAPDISLLTVGKSETGALGSPSTAQTLLSAVSNIVLLLGDRIFANPVEFQEAMKSLSSPISTADPEQDRRTFNFIEDLESFIRGTPQVNITDTKNYPLYIWFAAANFDRSESEKTSAPMLEDPPAQEKTPAATIPAQEKTPAAAPSTPAAPAQTAE